MISPVPHRFPVTKFHRRKTAHTDSAMIAAAGAGPVFRFHTERFYFRSAWQGRSMLFSKLIFGFKCHSIGTHEARNIRTDDFLSRQTFKSAEYRVIIKGTAFRHDMIPQLFSRLQLNDAEERILTTDTESAAARSANPTPRFCTFFT